MDRKSKSKVTGESSGEAERLQLGTQSSKEASTDKQADQNTLATSANTPDPASLMIFQPTMPLEVDETTANAKLIATFASNLGALVFWKRLELANGQDVIALCFPMDKWLVSSANELVMKPTDSGKEEAL